MHTWEILGLPVYQYCPRFPVWNSTKCWGLDLKFHIFITQSTRIEDNTRVLLPFLDYIFVLHRTSKFWFCSSGSRTISSYWYLWFQKSSNTRKTGKAWVVFGLIFSFLFDMIKAKTFKKTSFQNYSWSKRYKSRTFMGPLHIMIPTFFKITS